MGTVILLVDTYQKRRVPLSAELVNIRVNNDIELIQQQIIKTIGILKYVRNKLSGEHEGGSLDYWVFLDRGEHTLSPSVWHACRPEHVWALQTCYCSI